MNLNAFTAVTSIKTAKPLHSLG